MAITDGGSSPTSNVMTPEEQKLVEEMNRNLRLTGHTNPPKDEARPMSWRERLFGKHKSTERA